MRLNNITLRYCKKFSILTILLFLLVSCNPKKINGNLIAYYAYQARESQIFILDLETNEKTQLTDIKSNNSSPIWSPDGTQIVFETNRDGNFEIYVMNADGSNSRNITNHSAKDWGAAWSPDGKWIAFNSDRDGDNEIYLLDVMTNAVVQLTHNNINDYSPTWSPDNTQIAYVSSPGNSDLSNINVMNIDGSNKTPLISSFGISEQPAWSPNGDWLAFVSNENGITAEIYLYRFEDKQVIQLTRGDSRSDFPAWSPDSSKILFIQHVRGPHTELDMFIINVEGTGITKFMEGGSLIGAPAWQP